MKKCSKCYKVKPFTEFHKQSDSKDGHRSHCKKCRSKQRIADKKWKEAIEAHYKREAENKVDDKPKEYPSLVMNDLEVKEPLWMQLLTASTVLALLLGGLYQYLK